MRFVISGTIAGLVLASTTSFIAQADGVSPPPIEQADGVSTPPTKAVKVTTSAVPAVTAAAVAEAKHADKDAADLVAEIPARRTDDYGLVGVTWTRGFDDTGMAVHVRQRTKGAWSAWRELDIESDEGEGGRDGTEPLWVGASDGIAVRVTSPTGKRPRGLAVATIDPGSIPSEASITTASSAFYRTTGAVAATQIADGSPTYTPKPTIISRASWGATKNTYCDSLRISNETRGVIVHHTAGSNSYSKSDSKAIVRAVQAYHMKGRDWCDIGYNFLVDKYGQIFEGRNGGVDRAVRGAHAGDKTVNTYTMGVSMMGTFTSTEPSYALKSSMVRLIGWRLGTTFHPAKGTYTVGGYTLNRIAGHRNVVSTACPGAKAYAWLSRSDGLRDRVAAYISGYRSSIKSRAQSLGAALTGPVAIGEFPTTGGRKAQLQHLDLYASTYGTYYLSGYFRTGYNSLRAQLGILGMPTGDAATTPVPAVWVQRFVRGSIYRVTRSGRSTPYAMWGGVDAKFRELGEASGALGAPTKGEMSISGGRFRAYFDHGYITRSTTGAIAVTYY
jgi:uncharacterized protein with LGFP repeats